MIRSDNFCFNSLPNHSFANGGGDHICPWSVQTSSPGWADSHPRWNQPNICTAVEEREQKCSDCLFPLCNDACRKMKGTEFLPEPFPPCKVRSCLIYSLHIFLDSELFNYMCLEPETLTVVLELLGWQWMSEYNHHTRAKLILPERVLFCVT